MWPQFQERRGQRNTREGGSRLGVLVDNTTGLVYVEWEGEEREGKDAWTEEGRRRGGKEGRREVEKKGQREEGRSRGGKDGWRRGGGEEEGRGVPICLPHAISTVHVKTRNLRNNRALL